MIKITETVKHGLYFVGLEGTLDYGNRDKLKEHLDVIIDKEKNPKIVMDLKTLEYMSSVGWGVLVDYAVKTREKGGNMVLARMNDRIGRLYDLMGIRARIDYCSEIDDTLLQIFK